MGCLGLIRLALVVAVCSMCLSATAQVNDGFDKYRIACSSQQLKDLQAAIGEARNLAKKASAQLPPNNSTMGSRFRRWFGGADGDYDQVIKSVFDEMQTTLLFQKYWCLPPNSTTPEEWIHTNAFVLTGKGGEIFVLSNFFTLPATGVATRGGTIVHEASHQSKLRKIIDDDVDGDGSDDYGPAFAQQRAKQSATQARANADNFKYFAEDIVYGVAKKAAAVPKVTGPVAGYQLASLFSQVADSKCRTATTNKIYFECRDAACGQEIINQQPFDDQVDSGGAGCGFQASTACSDRIRNEYRKTVDGNCQMSCTGNKFKGLEAYHTWSYKGVMGDLVNKNCRTPGCNVEREEPATFEACRHVLHPADSAAILAAMNTGRDADRAAGLLVEVLRREKGIPENVILAIETAAAEQAPTQRELAARLDRIRIAVKNKGPSVTVDDIKAAAAEVSQLALSSARWDASALRVRSAVQARAKKQTKEIRTADDVRAQGFKPAQPKLYQGVDTITGEAKGPCVVPPTEKPTSTSSRDITFKIDRFDSYEALAERMFGSASVSAIGTGGAEAEFSREFRSSAESIHLLVDVTVTLTNRQAASANQIDKDYADLLTNRGIADFFKACGNAYISAELKGARFRAVLTIYASSREEHTTMSAALAAGVTGSWSATAGFEAAMSKLAKLKEIHTYIDSSGFPSNEDVPSTPEEIIEFAKNFQKKVNGTNAKTLDYETTGYETTANFHSPDPFITRGQTNYLARADRALLNVHALLSTIDYMRKQPERYDWKDVTLKDLAASEDVVFEDEQTILDAASACYRDVHKCVLAALPSRYTDVKLPIGKPKVIYSGGCKPGVDRFANYNGGCLDKSTLIVWSSISEQYHNFNFAVGRCADLNENQTAPGTWTLPSMYEFQNLISQSGGSEGFKQGATLNNAFWTHDGSSNRKPIWVNGGDGSAIQDPDPGLRLLVVCKQS